MQKNWNSAVPMRLAVSCSAWSIDLPILIRSQTSLNSSPTGPGISRLTTVIVSLTGRPERKPRTRRSSASGKLALNLRSRLAIILPTTMCGKPRPAAMLTKKAGRNEKPRSVMTVNSTIIRTAQTVIYWLSVHFLPVWDRRRARCSGFGMSETRSWLDSTLRDAITLRMRASMRFSSPPP